MENSDIFTATEVNFLENNFGGTPSVLLENQYNYLKELGYQITFKAYSGIAHYETEEMKNDVKAFFKQYK